MAAATYDDVNLILKLYELRREDELRKARAWFAGSYGVDSASEVMSKYPHGTDENRYARMVTSHYEMVASFIAKGVLNQELFFQSGRELLLVYLKLKHILPEFRTVLGDSLAFVNLEKVGEAYLAYLEKEAPGSGQGFAERVKGMRK